MHAPVNAEFIDRNGRRPSTIAATSVFLASALFLAASASAQSAKDIRGASPYNPIENEPAPRLTVDAPLPEPLSRGIVELQFRLENVHIVPVFGAVAMNVSPRLGHLHVTMDDLPWHWVVSNSEDNTIAVVGLQSGQHKMMVEVVDAQHHSFAACTECIQTVAFTVPSTESHAH